MTRQGVTLYFTLFAVIVWCFTMVPSAWLEKTTAEASSYVLRALGLLSSWGVRGDGSYLTLWGEARPVTVQIIRECTAINVFSVMAGLILPLRNGSLPRKAIGIAFSGLLLFLLNVSRITLTVFLTGFDVPPFSWFLTDPTIEVYHYPVSFAYGVIGVALLVVMVDKWILPELGETLMGTFGLFYRSADYARRIIFKRKLR
ncbi:MAG: exosortase/archaeosortase family protein [Candidatus Bathyarchaeota archaeon]|nr:exosortase/archaeosortase family protein [Candidatus Bathyarchaeota archaeon]